MKEDPSSAQLQLGETRPVHSRLREEVGNGQLQHALGKILTSSALLTVAVT